MVDVECAAAFLATRISLLPYSTLQPTPTCYPIHLSAILTRSKILYVVLTLLNVGILGLSPQSYNYSDFSISFECWRYIWRGA